MSSHWRPTSLPRQYVERKYLNYFIYIIFIGPKPKKRKLADQAPNSRSTKAAKVTHNGILDLIFITYF